MPQKAAAAGPTKRKRPRRETPICSIPSPVGRVSEGVREEFDTKRQRRKEEEAAPRLSPSLHLGAIPSFPPRAAAAGAASSSAAATAASGIRVTSVRSRPRAHRGPEQVGMLQIFCNHS